MRSPKPVNIRVEQLTATVRVRVRIDGRLGGLTPPPPPQFPCSFHCDLPPNPQLLSSYIVADPPSSFFTIRTLVRVNVCLVWRCSKNKRSWISPVENRMLTIRWRSGACTPGRSLCKPPMNRACRRGAPLVGRRWSSSSCSTWLKSKMISIGEIYFKYKKNNNNECVSECACSVNKVVTTIVVI